MMHLFFFKFFFFYFREGQKHEIGCLLHIPHRELNLSCAFWRKHLLKSFIHIELYCYQRPNAQILFMGRVLRPGQRARLIFRQLVGQSGVRVGVPGSHLDWPGESSYVEGLPPGGQEASSGWLFQHLVNLHIRLYYVGVVVNSM